MGNPARVITVDTVTLKRHEIASIFAEMARRATPPTPSLDWPTARADAFIGLACELAAGLVPRHHALHVAGSAIDHAMSDDQGRALELLERLAEGGRFILEDERFGRALQYWVSRGYAACDEEGYFLTPSGRTFAESILP